MYVISEHLLDNGSIEILDLSVNEIGVEGCIAIEKYLTSAKCILKKLYLSSNRAGDLGAKSMAVALEVNKSLQVLAFNYNLVNDIGLCYIAEGVANNTSLRVLTLFGNNFAQKSMGMYNKFQAERKSWLTDFSIYIIDGHFDMTQDIIDISTK